MKFGIFDYIDLRDEPLRKIYDDRMALLRAAEQAGFYGYHLTEHHATPLSMTPSPTVFLAAAARETSRIRLGSLLHLLPFYHPLRLLEELCMLDHLSGGRLDIGVGRGVAPPEFEAYNVDLATSQEAYEQALALLRQGLTRERIDGRYGRYAFRDVPVVIPPLQKPHPPFWYGLRSSDQGPLFAARQGMNGVTLGPDERCAATLAAFHQHWLACADARRELNSPVQSPIAGVMRTMFIADTDADADRIARPAYARWYDSLGWLWKKRGVTLPISIPEDFDKAKAAGTLVVGGPETVARIFAAQAQVIGHNYLVLMLAFGSLTHAQEMRSLDLFRREVMPRLVGFNEAEPANVSLRARESAELPARGTIPAK
jgi:alkanesulfonate monooxygenase SsuD/methylene tetrahydromethanopterin reductase-like flavin-dependent oxidoreductase (luciferase family)